MCNIQSERHLTFPLTAGALVPWRIAIIMENLPGVRQERFTAEETDVLVTAVKDREVALYGDGRNPSKLAEVKRAWEEIATIVSTAGIPRRSHQASGAERTGWAVRKGQLRRASANTMVQSTGLHWDWVSPGPAGPNPNVAGAGCLNFAAGGNGRLNQTLREQQDDGVNKWSGKKKLKQGLYKQKK